MSHLQAFVEAARLRAATLPSAAPGGHAAAPGDRRSLRAALAGRDTLSVIAEFKRRSPSQGVIDSGADPAGHVRRATQAGAAALSVLTEPNFFGGSYEDLVAVRALTALPIIAKDFVVDPRQVAAAAVHGADAVLLVLRCLDGPQLLLLLDAARRHGLEVVLECHDRAEIERALAVPDAMLGINNRDLDTLEVDLARARTLLPAIPAVRCTIAESGYRTPLDLQALRGLANGVLIGTSIMKGADLGALVSGGRAS